jgi:oxygen-dependent protoporphyrinogen oxidase
VSDPSQPPEARHVVVVGGGVAGLAAAYALRRAEPSVRVSVLEAGPVLGGKLRTGEVAGITADLGAEALLNRRPEAVDLARAVGLADDVEHPATSQAWLWSRGRMRVLPPVVMGVPAELGALARSRALSAPGLVRATMERLLPARPTTSDVPVGRLVSARFGAETRDRLVEPLLGGVYAGHADELSLRATVPQLAPAVDGGRSLLAAAGELRRSRRSDAPVFAGLAGGVGRLVPAVAAAAGAQTHTGVTVRSIARSAERKWRLVTGPVPAPRAVEADAVVLAVPAGAAGRLLSEVAPYAAAELAGIAYASVAIVTLAYAASAFPEPLAGSGFLVPPVDRRLVKASTYSTNKWGWLRRASGETVIVRCSVGRHREVSDLQRDDADLGSLVAADFADATGVRGAPVDLRVTRWGGSLPQYGVGHLDRVARIRAAVAVQPGLAVCGAAYDGVGVAACIASAQRAVDEVMRALSARETMQP